MFDLIEKLQTRIIPRSEIYGFRGNLGFDDFPVDAFEGDLFGQSREYIGEDCFSRE